jgi:site-specific recombinase XerC
VRHTAASLAIASGANIKIVQQMLGHKSATMTFDLYGHLFPDQLDEVAERVDQAVRDRVSPSTKLARVASLRPDRINSGC